jgi:predicted ATPase/ribosome-binding protein aMBF1 (putative translation factor)
VPEHRATNRSSIRREHATANRAIKALDDKKPQRQNGGRGPDAERARLGHDQRLPRATAPFGELLKRHRLASGVSQEALAERARISTSAIGALERGARRAPYRETVALLSGALGLSDAEHAQLEAAAQRVRGRQSRAGGEAPAVHNLPSRLTSFVGRDEEIAEIRSLVVSHRLVTLTGSGGVGKTRTAVEVARLLLGTQYEEVWFVDLSPVGDGAFVAGALASVLDVPLAQVADPLPSLAAGLKTRKLLLILDNCEHIVRDAAAAAGTLLSACPGIVIMATSRERLGIEGERVYRLPSLFVPTAAPASTEEAHTHAALRLFIERAVAIESRLVFTAERLGTVAEICRRLEGIPLAIEMAATRLPTLGFDTLNKRLKEHFAIAGGARDLPQRQRTMLATISWSYDLLSETERMLLRRLAIFRGGFTLAAAEAVCADESLAAQSVSDLLSFLVDKSLLSMTLVFEQSRYGMLESVRAFASGKSIDAGEFTPIARAHAGWLATVADRGDALYPHVSAKRWLAEFGVEIDNARGALGWALEAGTDEDAVFAGRIVGGLRRLWISTERRIECRRWAEAILHRVDVERFPVIATRLVRALIQSIDGTAVFAVVDRAIPLFERIGDRRGLISLHAHVAWEYGLRGEFVEAEHSIAQAFAIAAEQHVQHSRQYVHLLQARCLIRALAGRLDEARSDCADAVKLRGAVGDEDLRVHYYWKAFFAFTDGEVARSAELLETCVEHARAQFQSPAGPLSELAAARLVLGEVDLAEAAAHDALELAYFEQLDGAWRPIQHLAAVAALRGNFRLAARLGGFVDAWCEQKRGYRGYYERAGHDVLVSSLRDHLSTDAIATFAAQGASLAYDRAVDEALGV